MKRIGPLLGLCLLASGAVTQACADPPVPTTRDILADIQAVRAANGRSARGDRADRLLEDLNKVWYVWAMDSLDGEVIDAMIPLLRDDNDLVRMDAAAGIGLFGPRAGRAVPALKHARKLRSHELAKMDISGGSGPDSLGSISVALDRIKGVPDDVIFKGDPRERGPRPK